MTKIINSKFFWVCVVTVLGLLFCVQLGMQFRGTPEDVRARELDRQIQQVTAEEHELRATLPQQDGPDEQFATLHAGDSGD